MALNILDRNYGVCFGCIPKDGCVGTFRPSNPFDSRWCWDLCMLYTSAMADFWYAARVQNPICLSK